ncbi:hypothetical protein GUJ93_ZPchr0004g38782 [Zizania palustris]|uniref:Uncharacterized protein n=1 Tax=Zizania palustris TaxID=103762 RepID=A0A8J5RZ86_ZIZPA|nr:hypothetical protein GUJ93_ZPchr0004g38782 [Zizania palustris]
MRRRKTGAAALCSRAARELLRLAEHKPQPEAATGFAGSSGRKSARDTHRSGSSTGANFLVAADGDENEDAVVKL